MREVDADTWLPVAFFTYVDTGAGTAALHQLWVTPVGQTEWRKVPLRGVKELVKQHVYADCAAFGDEGTDEF